ncbi:hypothetical protein [Acinetobacter sp. UBA801]|uniref:hypothetical protein n=1 Tax=Acinetobacter sp. UBA801 TaxID=1945958 RepID=UPI0025C716EA|nr:hypothetical protein [Acinetobacter sp. UBA801]
MSDFITDVEQQYEVYCKIAEEHGFIDLNAKKNSFRCTTKLNEFNAGWIAFTGAVATVRDEQQSIIDQLNSVLEERTKEWLQAIECRSYFENVAKPLKEENYNLKAQLNNMEQCYIQLKQEHNELIAFNTVQDRKQKAAEKVAEKYKRKVLMIADLLRDSTDKDMTLKAIQTVIERVSEHV